MKSITTISFIYLLLLLITGVHTYNTRIVGGKTYVTVNSTEGTDFEIASALALRKNYLIIHEGRERLTVIQPFETEEVELEKRKDKTTTHADGSVTIKKNSYEFEVVDRGDDDDTWNPASCCANCQQGTDLVCRLDLSYSFERSWSYAQTYGIEMSFGLVSEILTLGMSRSYQETYTIEESISKTDTLACTFQGYTGTAQIWYSVMIHWADIRFRKCSKNNCGEWSMPFLVSAPDKSIVQVACRNGDSITECDAAGLSCAANQGDGESSE